MYFSSLEFLLRIRVIKVLLKNMQKLKKKKKKKPTLAIADYCQSSLWVNEHLFKFSNKNTITTQIAEAF